MYTISTAPTTECTWQTTRSGTAVAAPSSDTAWLSLPPTAHVRSQGGQPRSLSSLVIGYVGRSRINLGVSVLPKNAAYHLSSRKSFLEHLWWSPCSA